jgi:hypothetical protein
MKELTDAEKITSYEGALKHLWPKTVRQAAEMLIAHIHPDERDRILLLPEASDMIKYHMSIGMWLRNNFGLWWAGEYNNIVGNCWLMQDAKKKHPDDVSHMVLEEVWLVLRQTYFPNKAFPEQVSERYKEERAKQGEGDFRKQYINEPPSTEGESK